MVGIRWNDWNTMPTRPRRKRASPSSPMRVISVPATVTRPVVALSRPAATISSDDLPEPDGPSSATVSPAGILSVTPFRMFTGPAALDSVSVTSSKLMAGGEFCIDDSRARQPYRRYGMSTARLKRMLSMIAVIVFAATGAVAAPVKILALGTSLTQGYGVAPGLDFTAVLEDRLRADHLDVKLINAGVSGDTSAGGLSRVDWSLADHP